MGRGPDDRGLTGDDIERLAVPVAAPLDPDAAADAERRAELDAAGVAEAVRLLMRRAYPEAGIEAGFPWPGSRSTWPGSGDDTAGIAPGSVLVGDAGVPRADWKPLWMLAGPLAPDRVAVLVAPTGRGKTAFAVQVAEAAAAEGHPVIYLSAELGVEELAARLLAIRAGGKGGTWPAWRDLLRGEAIRKELKDAGARLVADCPALYLAAPPVGKRTLSTLRGLVREAARRHGAAPLVVVDYLQRLEGESEDRRLEVSALSGGLRNLARPGDGYLGAGVLALSSTARSNYAQGKGERPLRGFFDLWKAATTDPDGLVGMGKETGEIEYDASLVLVLTCDHATDDDDGSTDDDLAGDDATRAVGGGTEAGRRRGCIAVAKNREGLTGAVRLDFDGARGWWGDGRSLGRWKPKPKEGAGKKAAKPNATRRPEPGW